MSRKMRAPTEDRLMRAALHYLDRYGSSAGNLHRVLERKVWRVAAVLEEDPASYMHMVDAVVARCEASGLVDDKLYAESKIASERRKGRSTRRIAAVLQTKGISRTWPRRCWPATRQRTLPPPAWLRARNASAHGARATRIPSANGRDRLALSSGLRPGRSQRLSRRQTATGCWATATRA
ncbi:MAG: RecX family transcriptional regulator [Alphaproteobacteria bacterium]|nr:RecX family transcriptional regulator [Alphaproteobacteria bacterium]